MIRVRRRQRSAALDEASDRALELADQQKAISGKIRELEHFISEAPGRAAEAEIDRLETIPPPEELTDRQYRHPVTGLDQATRLSRCQAATLRAERRRNMLVFLLAATLFVLFASWLSQNL